MTSKAKSAKSAEHPAEETKKTKESIEHPAEKLQRTIHSYYCFFVLTTVAVLFTILVTIVVLTTDNISLYTVML